MPPAEAARLILEAEAAVGALVLLAGGHAVWAK